MSKHPKPSVHELVDHLFRHEAGKLVATLTRIFGPSHFELAEDVVQDTLLTALFTWGEGDVPDNPAAWITQVAKRRAINELKHQQRARKNQESAFPSEASPENIDAFFLETEVRDSQLRMIFACCHPKLSLEAQLCLTLKTLGGFGIREIASALLTSKATVNKRLYRAKQKLRSGEIPLVVPTGKELDKRLDAVLLTLYLLFNEGYHSAQPEAYIRRDLCLEAMRLCRLLAVSSPTPSVNALLALMCFHAARFDARMDQDGTIIIFQEQNRSLWDHTLISKGMQYLHLASGGNVVSTYHLEAGIAAEHCLAESFETTDWKSILYQYEQLYQLNENPLILLNMSIVVGKTKGPEKALEKLTKLEKNKLLMDYFLLPASQGTFLLEMNKKKEARSYFEQALALTSSTAEKKLITQQLKRCHPL